MRTKASENARDGERQMSCLPEERDQMKDIKWWILYREYERNARECIAIFVISTAVSLFMLFVLVVTFPKWAWIIERVLRSIGI